MSAMFDSHYIIKDSNYKQFLKQRTNNSEIDFDLYSERGTESNINHNQIIDTKFNNIYVHVLLALFD